MIDVVITDYTPEDRPVNRRVSPSDIARDLTAAGYTVRSVVVIAAHNGLTSTHYAEEGSWPTSKGKR